MLCKGVITRKCVTTKRTEESSIDLVMLSDGLAQNVEKVLVHEERNHVLIRITKTKSGTTIKPSDHNVIITQMNIPWSDSLKIDQIEILNFKNQACQQNFYEATSNNTYLSSSCDGHDDINIKTKVFLKHLDRLCKKVLKVIRVKNKKEKQLDELYNKWNDLRKKEDEASKEECKKLENELEDIYAKEYFDKIEKNNVDPEKGGFNSGNMWKLKKEMFPQSRDPPTAMLDSDGVLQTDSENIRSAALKSYDYRLRNRQIKPGLEPLQLLKENICSLRLKKSHKKDTRLDFR